MNSEIRNVVENKLKGLDRELREISLKIHDDPEMGNQEFHAYALLTGYLEKNGFKISHQVAGLETCFIAEYGNSSSGRRVGLCCEYDALPGVGHACGHNLISISGLAAALSLKALMEQNLIQGKIVLFGTPAEESTNGKATLVNEKLVQNNVDYAMMLHPFANDGLYRRMLALDSLDVEFFGEAAHAGMKPWAGINALDALMMAFDNIGLLRQQMLPTNRIHGIIKHGGDSPNVIPAYTSGKFYARAQTKNQLTELRPRVENCFKAAAKATQCQVKLHWADVGPLDDVFMNDTMTLRFKKYEEEQGITFDSRSDEEQTTTGSTDFGNFSYVVPGIHPAYGIHTTAANHTRGFTEATRTEQAHTDTLVATKSLIFTAVDVMMDDAVYDQVVADFKKGKPQ